jgi:hypothetical protein
MENNGVEDLQKALHFLQKYAETKYGLDLLGEYKGQGKSAKGK